MSDLELAQEYIKIIAKHVIQDWENLEFLTPTGESKGQTPYSPENVYELLLRGDPNMDLSNWIIEFKINNYLDIHSYFF